MEKIKSVQCVDFSNPPPHPWPAGIHFHKADITKWLEKYSTRADRKLTRAAILDPPREGLGKDLRPYLDAFRNLNVREILYVGCEPDAWASASKKFNTGGWKLEALAALDLFPQTHHVETMARLKA